MPIDPDLELAFTRQFAVGGLLPPGSDINDRRERIRVAIYNDNLVHKPFRDTGLSYAQAYESCFGRPIEMRRTVRSKPKVNPPPYF